MENRTDDIMSPQIDQLATALAKAQGEYLIASKDKKNPFFKSNYADLESVVAASRPALAKYGLSVVQPPFIIGENGNSYLITILMHASGQWIKSKAQHNPQKNDIQSLSSYNTYLKRMCYTSLLGVVTGEDDDGNAASTPSPIPQYLFAQIKALPDITQRKIMDFSKINNLNELTLEQYDNFKSDLKSKA